ncbi:hypothetical protein [Chryseobacterium sp. NFX27]|uniref:hypothetical protein n=1 Tax=Chryseobacterium sp. NFX27 TaxID=2819618 RepID=UPI003CF9A626
MKRSFVLSSLTISLFFLQSCKKDILLDMNNVEMPNYEELVTTVNTKDTLKVLIIGNSITSHGVAKEIGWNHKSGMAATNYNKDFVHLLFEDFKKKNTDKNIILRYANYSNLERSPEKVNLKDSKIQNLYKFNPEYIVYQLGDNSTKANADEFEKVSVKFLEGFKSSKKYVVSPYFMNVNNYKVTKNISTSSKSNFVDISYISNNKKYSANQYPGSIKKVWKAEGIAAHPGDLGMLLISQQIFKKINPENQQLSLQ